jgi:hypothetical protein
MTVHKMKQRLALWAKWLVPTHLVRTSSNMLMQCFSLARIII